MKSVKSVLEYNKALLDEAEDDVDSLLAAEGNAIHRGESRGAKPPCKTSGIRL